MYGGYRGRLEKLIKTTAIVGSILMILFAAMIFKIVSYDKKLKDQANSISELSKVIEHNQKYIVFLNGKVLGFKAQTNQLIVENNTLHNLVNRLQKPSF